MISDLAWLYSSILDLFQMEFTIYGFTFSLWQVFCFDIVVGIVAWGLGKVFFND